jgi:sugar lactone lactonase YvrE
MRKLFAVVCSVVLTCLAVTAWAGKVDTWRQSTAADFEKGKTKQTVISDRGQIRLSRELKPWSELSAAFVWDLVHDKDGNLYAATGEEGKIFKVTPDGKATVLFDSDEQHVFTLALAADGTLYAGTAPGGLVLKITPDGKATTHYKTGKNYVWKLVIDPKGVLYAATGTKAEVFKINPDGTGASLYAAKQNHMLSLAIGNDGMLYAGCDGDGLIYRINPQGKAFVMYDAQQEEIHTLFAADDGTLYAGTSSPAQPMPGRPPGGLLPAPAPPPGGGTGTGGAFESSTKSDGATKVQTGQGASTRPATDGAASPNQGSTPRPQPGQNAIYRISTDGGVREVFQDRVLVLSIAQQNQRLLVGTGQQGQLFDLDDVARERSEIARLDHGVITCMARRPDGTVVIGTGDPGKLYTLTTGYAAKGTFESQVFDAGMISRWGAIRWQADAPEGTKITLAVRSGNVKTPDDTWTDWSIEQIDPQTATIPCPASRFVQFRASLESARSELSPTLRAVMVRYMTLNQAPEITKIEIPDVGEGDGSTRQAKLKIKWEAKDPNNDELEYSLSIRKEGWKAWVKLPDKLTKKEHDLDTDSIPDGYYRIRIEAADRADNPPENVLTGARESALFAVDHTSPQVEVKSGDAKPGEVAVEVRATDSLTRVVGASYSIDSSPWTKIFPVDQIFDSKSETFRFAPADLKPGSHVVMVRVVDGAGNVGSGDLVFSVESAGTK